MNDVITEEKIDRYLDITRRALEKIKVVTPDRSFSKRLAYSSSLHVVASSISFLLYLE